MKETAAGKIRVLLIDALGLVRASLGRMLSSEPGFEVAGECETSAEALAILNTPAAPAIDLVLLDFDLGTEHAGDFIPAAREAGYQGQFLIVAGTADVRSAALALTLGAAGVFLKAEPPERLVQAIRLVMSGGVWVDRKIVQLLANQVIELWPRPDFRMASERLNGREQKVLLGVLGGLTNRKIGDGLGISESAAKNILQHLFAVAGVRTRSQLVRVALEGSISTIRQLAGPESSESIDVRRNDVRRNDARRNARPQRPMDPEPKPRQSCG
jgi:DNA-binding NarL/FixJ family response regulator